MTRLSRGTLAVLLAVAGSLPARAQTAAPSAARNGYESCLAHDDAAFRKAIEGVTIGALEASIKGLDYRPIVAAAWRKGGIDDVMTKSVDTTLEDLRQETSWSELIASLASKETQEKLATAAAERVYHAPAMKRAIEGLAVEVGREVGSRLELATGDAAEEATRCLKDYVGPRYGRTVATAVARDAGEKFSIDAANAKATVSRTNVLAEGKEGIAGLVVVIMRRQLGNLAARVGQRLVGAVLGRVVSAVAGGIGLVLIAKDIWELRNGVLPIIASEMKSPAMRDKVQAELAATIETEVAQNVREIGKRTADGVVGIWDEFRRAHAKVVELAGSNAEFKQFSDSISPKNLARLDEIVLLQLAHGGEPALLRRVADGSLGEAVERWPTAAMDIARDRRSLDAGFKWRALAGDALLPKVTEFSLQRRADPDALNRASLVRILELEDQVAIGRLAGLDARALEPLLELKTAELRTLARALGEVELASLSGYMTALDKSARPKLLRAVARKPAVMRGLASDQVRGAVLASRDQSAALDILLRDESLFDAALFVRDAAAVRDGAVSYRVLLAHYPLALVVLGIVGLAFLMLLMRAIVGRRPRKAPSTSGTA